MKFGQLIEYDMDMVEKLIEYGGETGPRPFSKKSKLSKSLDRLPEILKLVFIVCQSRGKPKYIATEVLTTCCYFIQSFFKKQNEVWNYSPWLIFCIIFQEKYFSPYNLL